ncbi:TasA family protein [Tissierella creatinophila]|uniref:Camelysin metallo-endopeptidase n=1 Tax=Tissierella creatinophila DSM 6911 TaxID=1123403 RepID=A0A1U7M4N4_TISCR|nr:TasA family protein [Tissierella creatinophila]OLS02179.1 camelysin metallo-endopeptidase [Tissierella creatinophila DSM 6911]
MKNKKIMLGSAIMLAVLLVAGGTMAWFTAQSDPVSNNFKAGTLKIELTDIFVAADAQNVNPGDQFNKEVSIKNTGTKRAMVRIKKDFKFDGNQNIGVVNYALGENWILNNDGYYYYTKVLQPNESTTMLFKDKKIKFDGAAMDNSYQGAKLNITIKAEAIQATNNAPTESGWKYDPLYVAPVTP